MSIRIATCCCLCFAAWGANLRLSAQESDEPRPVSYGDLVALGEQIESLWRWRDNVFLYKQRREELQRRARALPGARVTLPVFVERVSQREVFLRTPDSHEVRLAIQHAEAPRFGNLHTVCYPGSLATWRAQILSRPIGLRIGNEIEPEIAQRLRADDLLVLEGRLEALHLLLELFEPEALVVVSKVSVQRVVPRDQAVDYISGDET